MTKRRSSGRKSRRSSRGRGKQRKLPTIHLTLDQLLDILGYLFLAVAAFTILSFLSANHGIVPAWWLGKLRSAFGWGAYLIPLFFGAVGIWLILRDFGDRLPRVSPAQVAGILLGYLALLITLHFPAALTMFDGDLQAAAEAGVGGGHLGAALGELLLKGLGGAGVAVVLVTWWLIVAALTLGVSVQDILKALQQVLDQLLPRTPTAPTTRAQRPPRTPLRETSETPRPIPITPAPNSARAPAGAPPPHPPRPPRQPRCASSVTTRYGNSPRSTRFLSLETARTSARTYCASRRASSRRHWRAWVHQSGSWRSTAGRW